MVLLPIAPAHEIANYFYWTHASGVRYGADDAIAADWRRWIAGALLLPGNTSATHAARSEGIC